MVRGGCGGVKRPESTMRSLMSILYRSAVSEVVAGLEGQPQGQLFDFSS